MTVQACMVCGHPVDRPWLENCPDLYLETGFRVNYRACGNCGLVQQAPIPGNTIAFYPDYPMHQKRKPAYSLARALFHRQVYFHPSADLKNGSLLDYGCGDGSYLQSVRTRVGRIFGFEPNPAIADGASKRLNAKVFCQADAMAAELAGSIDCITTHFVLEHVTDLHATFGLFSAVLKPGGCLHIAVPNIRSREARLFGRKWHGLDAPRHISFPDERSLKLLAGQHGFKWDSSRPAAFPNTLAASLATLIAGHYHHALFLAFMPLSIVYAFIFSNGTRVFTMQKQ